jgi:hypothetical protein
MNVHRVRRRITGMAIAALSVTTVLSTTSASASPAWARSGLASATGVIAGPHDARAPLTGSASCNAEGAGQFSCNASASGGTAPYWETWSGPGLTFTNASGNFAWGTCRPDPSYTYTVSATITDAVHAQFVAQARFKCQGGPPRFR